MARQRARQGQAKSPAFLETTFLQSVLLIFLAGTIAAQPQPDPAKRLTLLDRVVATVDDRAILESQINRELAARMESEKLQGRTVVGAEKQRIFNRILREEINSAVIAATAKSSGGKSPQEVQALVERYQQQQLEEGIRQAGSVQAFRRRFENRSLVSERERQRDEILRDLARVDLQRRIGDQFALLVTPKEIHRRWRETQQKRRRTGSANVGWVVFKRKQNESQGDFVKRVRLAASVWTAEQDMTAAQLADKQGGLALPDLAKVQDRPEDTRASWIKAFVAKAKKGQVSDPQGSNGPSLRLLKILDRDAGNPYRIHDLRVQRAIRNELIQEKLRKMDLRQSLRHKDKVVVWPPARR